MPGEQCVMSREDSGGHPQVAGQWERDMTHEQSTQEVAKQTVGNRAKTSGGRLATAALVVAALVLALTQMGTSEAPTSSVQVQFGCDGTMVIANVECALGVAGAFDQASPSAEEVTAASMQGERAPWCGPNHDVTMYGCARDGHDLVWSCGVSSATGTIAASDEGTRCESNLWLDALIVDAAATAESGGPQSSLCDVLTDVPAACTRSTQATCQMSPDRDLRDAATVASVCSRAARQ